MVQRSEKPEKAVSDRSYVNPTLRYRRNLFWPFSEEKHLPNGLVRQFNKYLGINLVDVTLNILRAPIQLLLDREEGTHPL